MGLVAVDGWIDEHPKSTSKADLIRLLWYCVNGSSLGTYSQWRTLKYLISQNITAHNDNR